ncbi:SAM-dependent methyltransferase [Sinimarinibacterium sp. NLF-5-8]|uniref:class I SAM-dependent methyltransferase n=1 Tax=Sinimarinibacterium sp. NLF-5-8 TaxID=2698684 RepID=UPI00137BADDA|nr:SAM-dependent methyltransferase [Sinimarinibacterium sp. NLF-5-8]QHS09840.1 SAM-dependent methyltransferase [Sinimarinibacterium sp. NLF-5-8]
MNPPLLTADVWQTIQRARAQGASFLDVSLDLGRSQTPIHLLEHGGWRVGEHHYPDLQRCKPRTVYYWNTAAENGGMFESAQRFDGALIKLIPTEWGAPTFEIDGIKMLPTARTSPFDDARRKVDLIQPRGKRILDTCGGLGYFARNALDGNASHILSFEKSASVLWLRSLNPWSPIATQYPQRLTLRHDDISTRIHALPSASVDAILHDPPRFGIAGELYAQTFYDQLARVLIPGGKLFHYTGSPNKLTSGRNLPMEVSKRLQNAGFTTQLAMDGVLAQRHR